MTYSLSCHRGFDTGYVRWLATLGVSPLTDGQVPVTYKTFLTWFSMLL